MLTVSTVATLGAGAGVPSRRVAGFGLAIQVRHVLRGSVPLITCMGIGFYDTSTGVEAPLGEQYS
jgi:hypothetical protein